MPLAQVYGHSLLATWLRCCSLRASCRRLGGESDACVGVTRAERPTPFSSSRTTALRMARVFPNRPAGAPILNRKLPWRQRNNARCRDASGVRGARTRFCYGSRSGENPAVIRMPWRQSVAQGLATVGRRASGSVISAGLRADTSHYPRRGSRVEVGFPRYSPTSPDGAGTNGRPDRCATHSVEVGSS
jgi:hypothetical protein